MEEEHELAPGMPPAVARLLEAARDPIDYSNLAQFGDAVRLIRKNPADQRTARIIFEALKIFYSHPERDKKGTRPQQRDPKFESKPVVIGLGRIDQALISLLDEGPTWAPFLVSVRKHHSKYCLFIGNIFNI